MRELEVRDAAGAAVRPVDHAMNLDFTLNKMGNHCRVFCSGRPVMI